MICDHELCRMDVIPRHPWHAAAWVREVCEHCGAERIVEHVMPSVERGDDVEELAALPWRTRGES